MSGEYIVIKRKWMYTFGIELSLILNLVENAPENLRHNLVKNGVKPVKVTPTVLRKMFNISEHRAKKDLMWLEENNLIIPHREEGKRFTYYTLNELEISRYVKQNYDDLYEEQDLSNPNVWHVSY